jgi:hypothetical protein
MLDVQILAFNEPGIRPESRLIEYVGEHLMIRHSFDIGRSDFGILIIRVDPCSFVVDLALRA